jgi:hypothetical protein
MKTAIYIVVTALSVLVAVSISHAQDSDAKGIYPAGTLLNYPYISGQYDSHERKVALPYYLNYNSGTHERFSLHRETGKEDSVVQREAFDVFCSPNLNADNVPHAIVNAVVYDFSNDRINKSSSLELPSSMTDVLQIGAAFFTNLAAHEFGHEVVAHYVGAEGSRLNFFNEQDGNFFLGTSSVEKIDNKSKLPYTMGGEFFADLTFEHALQDYRQKPNAYNRSLLVYSGTDFLWYCFYAFYLSNDNPAYDPITISQETGISREMLFSIALAKTLLNAYRIYSGQDKVIPYFTVTARKMRDVCFFS